ncbi:hypothetical protein D9M68_930280 [compost metagenome]
MILGNTHPTSFSDISDKFVYRLEITDSSLDLTKERVWSMDQGYREIRFGQELPDLSGVEFIDVVGVAQAEDTVAVAEFVQSVWQAAEPLAVRNNVKIGDHVVGSEEAERPALVDLKTRIAEDLEGSDLKALYEQLIKEIEA